MKYIQQNKFLICVAVLLVQPLVSLAQEEGNTGISVTKQYVNNSVPGLQYGPVKKNTARNVAVTQPENHSESSGMQIKKGTIRDVQFAGGGNAGFRKGAQPARVAATGNKPMASDQKAVAVDKVAKPGVTPIPLQEGQQPAEKVVQAKAVKQLSVQPVETPVQAKARPAVITRQPVEKKD